MVEEEKIEQVIEERAEHKKGVFKIWARVVGALIILIGLVVIYLVKKSGL